MKSTISIAIVDNFDSFTYNLYHYLQPLAKTVEVIRYDKINLEMIKQYNGIVLSPGPGLPTNYPKLKQIILEYGRKIPILGVCLGHQAIAETFGGKLFNMSEVWHGVARDTIILNEENIFNELPKHFLSGRYHSWAVSEENYPDCLIITARDENGTIMALKHKTYPIKGIQFHPESILTPEGKKIMENWVNTIKS